MMKKMKLFLITLIITAFTLVGCSQIGAKNFGGDYTIELPKGEKLVDINWKDNDLWYLTKPMNEDDEAEVYEFREDSTIGALEGTVTIVESK